MRFDLYPSLPVIFLSFQPVNRFESDIFFSLQNHLLRIEDKGWLDSILRTRLIEHKERKVEREGRAQKFPSGRTRKLEETQVRKSVS